MAIDDEGVIRKLMKPPERWAALLLASAAFPSEEASGVTEIATMLWFEF